MKKEKLICDNCEEEEPEFRIIKGKDKGNVYCNQCFTEWTESLCDTFYEDIEND